MSGPAQLGPVARTSLEQELASYAVELRSFWPRPDLDKLENECLADPVAVQKRNPQSFTFENWTSVMQSSFQHALCARDISRCADVSLPSTSGCYTNDCAPQLQLANGDAMAATPKSCSAYVGGLLFVKSAAEGHMNPELCRPFLATQDDTLQGSNADRACVLLADDYKTGRWTYCDFMKDLHPTGDPVHPYRNGCPNMSPLLVFAGGEADCGKLPDWAKTSTLFMPKCETLARVYRAAAKGSPSECGRDGLCKQAMGVDSACAPKPSPEIAKACRRYAKEAERTWFVGSPRAQMLMDSLNAVQKRLSSEQGPEADRLKAEVTKMKDTLSMAQREMNNYYRSSRGQGAAPKGPP
jgi:hypothetical protein